MNQIRVAQLGNYFTVISTARIPKGEPILRLEGIKASSPSKYSVQVGRNEHVLPYSDRPDDPSSAFRFVNHSCSPNAYFDIPARVLVALKEIGPDEEITFDYATTEYDMASPFQCRCGAKNCRGEIKGFRYLPAERQNELLPYLAPHLKNTPSLL